MKKILSIFAVATIALAACNPTQQPDPRPEPPTPGPEPEPSETIGTTAETAFTVAQAIDKAKEIGSTASSTTYFIKGYVVGLSENGIAKYGNINVYLADSASETDKTKEFTGFQIRSIGGAACVAGEVKKGDFLVICGPILYDATYGAETAGNGAGHIVSINGGGGDKPSGDYKPISISVSNITASTATVACEPGTETALYYYDVADKAEWDSYSNKGEYLAELIQLYKDLYEMFEIELDFELDLATIGPDSYDIESLDAESDYVVFAVYCDAEGKPLSEFYTKEFTTSASSQTDDYPTLLEEDFAFTPATVDVTYWGSCYAEDGVEETSFDVVIQDTEGNGVMLEAMAAAGVSKIDGTYTVDLTFQYSAGTLIPGWLYEDSAYSSWLFQGDNVVACITGGTVTITTSGETASVEVALEDILGHKITAKGAGLAYTYEDYSGSIMSVNALKSGRGPRAMFHGKRTAERTEFVSAERSVKTYRRISR